MRPAASDRPGPPIPSPGSTAPTGLSHPAVICSLLVLATLAVYLPVLVLDFVNYDDPQYITHNPHVLHGLTWSGIRWAFTHSHASNWHPLTWLSHMLDVQLWGLHPAGHHLTNLLFHITNALLLFLWWRAQTAATWRSAFVAALFALHPLHIESVAWVAERKDVLSTFFELLCLWAYARWTRIRSPRWYLLALAFFIGGLLSKPMVVTLPCLLLVLDYWPLQRFDASRPALSVRAFVPLLREKIPFFILAAASCVVTVWAQRSGGAVVPIAILPIAWRISNALVSYVLYLGKFLWPANLTVIYIHMGQWPAEQVALAGLLVAGITALAWWQKTRRPYLLVGWAWYVGLLVPVIGLVQVGNQSMADRYMYLPAVGLSLMLIWTLADVVATAPLRHSRTGTASPPRAGAKAALTLAAAMILAVCGWLSAQQLPVWQNGETLFRRALALNQQNFVAWGNLGSFLHSLGQRKQAEQCFRNALAIHQGYQQAYANLGSVLVDQKRYAEAVPNLQAALRLDPRLAGAHHNLGLALVNLGQTNEAQAEYETALRLDPDFALAHFSLANLLAGQGALDSACEHYRLALDPDSKDASIRTVLAATLAKQRKFDHAAKEYRLALDADPQSLAARLGLGDALLELGDLEAAGKQFTEALRSHPEDPEAHYHLAALLTRQGRIKEAVQQYHLGLRNAESSPEPLNNLAWLLAANPDAAVRNGREAVDLAERACKLSDYKQPLMLGTLAAAYAEAGRFADAVATAEKARALAEQQGALEVAAKNAQLLELYRAGKPCRDLP